MAALRTVAHRLTGRAATSACCSHVPQSRGMRLFPPEDGGMTVRKWNPFDVDTGDRRTETRDRLLNDLPSALRLLRACHQSGLMREGIDIAFEVDLGTTKKTRISPPNGTLILPNPVKLKSRKVMAVVSSPEDVELAKAAGADLAITLTDMTRETCGLAFDDMFTTPDLVNTIKTKYGRYLKTKTPSVNKGSVVDDIEATLREFKQTTRFRTGNRGGVRMKVAHLSWTDGKILENIRASMDGVRAVGPSERRMKYIKELHLNTSMGPGIRLDVNYLDMVTLSDEERDGRPFFLQKLGAGLVERLGDSTVSV